MKLNIEKIRLNELNDFVNSSRYHQFPTIPITKLRAKSYTNNPDSQSDDVVVYLGFVQNQLVAFRTLFAGSIRYEHERTRFAWCSGNWVHPDFRRKGFSEMLLKEALKDWDGKLMVTNYAPNSEKLYLKSGAFHAIHQFNGFRGYLFPKTRKLVHAANKNWLTKVLFSFADRVISAVSTIQLWFYFEKQNPDFEFDATQYPDEAVYETIQNYSAEYLLHRGKEELKWIFHFPWISDDAAVKTKKYPFSSYSNCFYHKTVKVLVRNKLVGCFIFSVREGHLKTLHFSLPDGIEKELTIFLKQYCAMHKIEVLTVYKSELAKRLFTRKFPFLHTKKFGQKIYSSFPVEIGGQYKFQDGDGDVIFT